MSEITMCEELAFERVVAGDVEVRICEVIADSFGVCVEIVVAVLAAAKLTIVLVVERAVAV